MSVDDRLSFGEGPLGLTPEPEPEEEKKRPNRAFLFIAFAMGGLILIGILALVAALVFWAPRQKAEQVQRATQTVDAMTVEAAAWTPTFTPSPTTVPSTGTPTPPPTWTPIPTATATRVVRQEPGDEEPTATPTRALSADWGGTTPSAGLGGLGTAAIAVGLAGLVFAVRRLRSPH